MNVYYCEESITKNLKDARCDDTVIKAFLCDLREKNLEQATYLLQKYRFNLLSELHKDQKRIDCLMFMIQKSKIKMFKIRRNEYD